MKIPLLLGLLSAVAVCAMPECLPEELYRREEEIARSIIGLYGTRPYAELRRELLDCESGVSEGRIVGAFQVFREAGDVGAIRQLLAAMPVEAVRDSQSWQGIQQQISFGISDRGELEALFQSRCPDDFPAISINPSFEEKLENDLQDPALRDTALRQANGLAWRSLRVLCLCLKYSDDPETAFRELILDRMASASGAERLHMANAVSLLVGSGQAVSCPDGIREFLKSLDYDGDEGVVFALIAEEAGEHEVAAERLSRLDMDNLAPCWGNWFDRLSVPEEERSSLGRELACASLLNHLIALGRWEEAQRRAEQVFSLETWNTATWRSLGKIAAAGGSRYFDDLFASAGSGMKDSPEYYMNYCHYYRGKDEPKRAVEVVNAGLEYGRESGNHDLVTGLLLAVAEQYWNGNAERAYDFYAAAFENALEHAPYSRVGIEAVWWQLWSTFLRGKEAGAAETLAREGRRAVELYGGEEALKQSGMETYRRFLRDYFTYLMGLEVEGSPEDPLLVAYCDTPGHSLLGWGFRIDFAGAEELPAYLSRTVADYLIYQDGEGRMQELTEALTPHGNQWDREKLRVWSDAIWTQYAYLFGGEAECFWFLKDYGDFGKTVPVAEACAYARSLYQAGRITNLELRDFIGELVWGVAEPYPEAVAALREELSDYWGWELDQVGMVKNRIWNPKPVR